MDDLTKPYISVCGYCLKSYTPIGERYSPGISDELKKELKQADEQVELHRDKYRFSHGLCRPHTEVSIDMMPNMTAERKASMLSKFQGNSAPCLLTDDARRHAYMRGIFTDQEIKSASEKTQQQNHAIVERFQTLSGIKKVYGD